MRTVPISSHLLQMNRGHYFPLSQCLIQTLFANDLYFITFYDNSLLQVVKIAMTEIYILIYMFTVLRLLHSFVTQ